MGAPVLPGAAGEPISPTHRQPRRAPRHMDLGRHFCLNMRPLYGDAINRQPRRRCLFLRSAPVLGVWRPEISASRYYPAQAPLRLPSIGTSSGSLTARNFGAALLPSPGAAGSIADRHQFWEFGPRSFGVALLPSPGAAGSIADRHQFWEFGTPKFRGRVTSQPRRRSLYCRPAPVLGVWRPEILGSRYFPAPAPLALSSVGISSGSLVARNFGATLLPSPGAAGSFVDRHQFWGFGAPNFRGHVAPHSRRLWVFRKSAPVLGSWRPGVSGAALRPSPGAAGSIVDRHQFWGFGDQKFRRRVTSQPRRRCLFRPSVPVV